MTSETRISEKPATDLRLVSLAMLNANWGEGRSYLDNFRPFVEDCVRTMDRRFTSAEMRGSVKDCFGIELPHAAIETLLKRLARDGVVEPEKAPRGQRRYLPVPERLRDESLVVESKRTRRQIEALIYGLTDFAHREHGMELTQGQAEDLLLSYIEEWALPLLRSSLSGSPLPQTSKKQDDDYIVASYVVDLWERDPQGAANLEALVKGSMLKSSLYLPDTGRIAARFKSTTAFLDTPLLLAALGVKGPEQKEAAVEVLEMARHLGANLACFNETASEVRGVLNWNADAMKPSSSRPRSWTKDRVHPTSDIISSGLHYSELNRIAANLTSELGGLSVKIVRRPAWDVKDNELEHDLKESLAERINYRDERPLDHDVQCLVSVHRLRGRRKHLLLEESQAIFITSNDAVVRIGREVLADGRGSSVPIAMLAHEFATLLWLKQPTLSPDLPRKQVIADCHAALNPSDTLWTRYLGQVDLLLEKGAITDDEYFLARNDFEVRRSLMSRTKGNPDAVNRDLTLETLKEVREKLLQPVREAAKKDVERERSRAIEAEATSALQAKQHELDMKATEEEVAERTRREAASTLASRLATLVSRMILCVLVPLVLVGLLTTVPPLEDLGISPLFTWMGGGILALLLTANLVFGTTVSGFCRKYIEAPLTRVLLKPATRLLGFTE